MLRKIFKFFKIFLFQNLVNLLVDDQNKIEVKFISVSRS